MLCFLHIIVLTRITSGNNFDMSSNTKLFRSLKITEATDTSDIIDPFTPVSPSCILQSQL